MADGTYKPIVDIREGDSILTTNGNTQEVTGIITRTNRPMYRMEFADGTELIISEDHPIMTSELGWACIRSTVPYKDAGMVPELSVGMNALNESGVLVPIVDFVRVEYSDTVYTLENTMFYANGWLVY